jgi:hypothetical protein
LRLWFSFTSVDDLRRRQPAGIATLSLSFSQVELCLSFVVLLLVGRNLRENVDHVAGIDLHFDNRRHHACSTASIDSLT